MRARFCRCARAEKHPWHAHARPRRRICVVGHLDATFLIWQVGDPAGFASRIVKLMAGGDADDEDEEEEAPAEAAAAAEADGDDGDAPVTPEVIEP